MSSEPDLAADLHEGGLKTGRCTGELSHTDGAGFGSRGPPGERGLDGIAAGGQGWGWSSEQLSARASGVSND
jgi:hypothetical protein